MSFFLFPGQGSQHPGMGHDFFGASRPAREIIDIASNLGPTGFLDNMFSGTAEELADTRLAQIALLTVEVAVARHLQASGFMPTGCAGHSLGEFSALVIADSLSFEDAFAVVRVRARLMSEDVPPGGMAAVVGLSPDAIEAALPPDVNIANYNGPQQTIISGAVEDLNLAENALKEAGARRVIRLPVSGPFHSKYMRRATEQFRTELASITLKPPSIPFISSVTAAEESDPETIRELLAQQISSPVRWTEVMKRIGPSEAVEVGPGRVLLGLAKRTEGAPQIQLAGTIEQVEALTANP